MLDISQAEIAFALGVHESFMRLHPDDTIVQKKLGHFAEVLLAPPDQRGLQGVDLQMTTPLKQHLLITLLALIAMPCHAQIAGAIGTAMRAKSIFEFYEAAIENPQQVLLLSVEIRGLYRGGSTRYKDLNNALAQKLGLFDAGPTELEHIELRPEPSPTYEYGYYSITLKKLTFKQCTALSNHRALNQNFVRVELNGKVISPSGAPTKTITLCTSQWFFQDGKNELKYVAY